MALERWTPEELRAAIETGEPVLVDLRADWCPQCGPQEAVLERVASLYQGRVRFGSLDVEAHPEIVDTYGVQGLPTMLLFRDGHLFEVLNGFKRAPLVRIALERLLKAQASAPLT